MNEQSCGDLKISGAGSSGGGHFNEVRISGAGSVSGDIECRLFKSSGASDIKGSVKAEELNVSGSSEIRGSLDAQTMTISGSVKVGGDVKTGKVTISGAAEICGNLRAGEIVIKGSSRIKGDCESESFTAKGAFNIQGLLSADDIRVSVGGRCKAREIGGERIEVSEGSGISFDILKALTSIFNGKNGLTAETIEGDEIYLEKTVAKVVRGNNVTIGRDSIIDLVEYKGDIRIIDGGVVREKRKI